MALPDLIEIVPLDKPVRAEITVPGSKSITNRALILAALAEGEVTLEGALWSEDTQIMVECLQELGFMVNVAPDPNEICNRTITVYGKGGKIPAGGTAENPMELFVGNAGTAARFLAAMVCLGNGVYRLSGVPRMNERPKAALFQALWELGYRVESPTDKLPAVVHGSGPKPGAKCVVNIEESSQFASALMLCAKVGGWDVKVVGENAEESPYVAMTSKLIEAFPKSGGTFQIEPDASSGSYFLASSRLNPVSVEQSEVSGATVSTTHRDFVGIARWPDSGWQVDERFRFILAHTTALNLGLECARNPLLWGEQSRCRPNDHAFDPQQRGREMLLGHCDDAKAVVISRKVDLGDSIMTAVILSPFSLKPVLFTDLGRLRLQECERVVALRTELTKCGAKVIEEDDTLTVYPSELHGTEIETYNDHRMAMCFAILGLKVPGIKLKNPACVKKTFPNFFQKLATPPPNGLGVTILDAKSGRKLEVSELFAE